MYNERSSPVLSNLTFAGNYATSGGGIYNGNYSSTAFDGHFVNAGYAWVTNHFKNNSQDCAWYDPWNWYGTCQDQCPIAYAIGNSAGDAQTRLFNERYNYTYGDPASNNYYWYYYYENCNPVGETSFVPQ